MAPTTSAAVWGGGNQNRFVGLPRGHLSRVGGTGRMSERSRLGEAQEV